MKAFYFALVAILWSTSLLAQTPYMVSTGASYSERTYVDLSNGETTSVAYDAWDIAFGVSSFSAAVFINEGVPLAGTSSELYLTTATNFDDVTADDIIEERIQNNEVSWSTGAFNLVGDPDDFADFGWGEYQGGAVTGTRIFALLGRDGVMRKIQITGLAGGVYTLRHALMDGSEDTTVEIAKADFSGKTLAYYSLNDGVVDLEPSSWDVVFCRYNGLVGPDGATPYDVTGVLHNKGITVAELDGVVDPLAEPFPSDNSMFNSELYAIGSDWKGFDFDEGWLVDEDRVYFLQREDGQIYRIVFVDFEGSGTGITTILVTDEGIVSSTQEVPNAVTSATLFPNPANTFAYLQLEGSVELTKHGILTVLTSAGRTVGTQQEVQLSAGTNQIAIDLARVPAGYYWVRLQLGNSQIIRPLVVTK